MLQLSYWHERHEYLYSWVGFTAPLHSCQRTQSLPPCPARRWCSLPVCSWTAWGSVLHYGRGCHYMRGRATCLLLCGGWNHEQASVKHPHTFPRFHDSPSQYRTEKTTMICTYTHIAWEWHIMLSARCECTYTFIQKFGRVFFF